MKPNVSARTKKDMISFPRIFSLFIKLAFSISTDVEPSPTDLIISTSLLILVPKATEEMER